MQFNSTQLDNGLTVITDYVPNTEAVSIQWALRSGAIHEDIHGTAHFLEHMLAAGKAKSGEKMVDALSEASVSYNLLTSNHNIKVFSNTVLEYLPEALSIIGDAVSDPVWDSEALERERQTILREYYEGEDNIPISVIQIGWSRPNGNHAFARKNTLGTPDTINQISNEVLLEYHASHFHAQRIPIYRNARV